MKSFNHYAYGACGEWQSYCEHGIPYWALNYTDLAQRVGGTTPDFLFGHLRHRSYLDEEAALVEEIEAEHELDELGTHHAAAVPGLIPFGPRERALALIRM